MAVVTAGCGGDGAEQELSGPAARGAELVETKGCLSCHSTDGSRGAGPTWEGLAGSPVELANGRSVVADEDYLMRSILEPDADTVAGFPAGLMASTVRPGTVTDDEAAAIVAYLKSLSDQDDSGNSEGGPSDR
ncbi:MAG: cytochrome c [Actinomycetota bacterium]|nr:cytochrome c [Actinomycetota bacterium]